MRLIILATAAALASGCDQRPDYWTAWVYPDANNLTKSQMTEGFVSFELCQQAAIDQLRRLPEPDRGAYECGHRCERSPGLSGYVCAETRK